MTTFYVRPKEQGRDSAADGKTYLTAWNGIEEVNWDAICASNPAILWICRENFSRSAGVLTVCIEWEYSAPRRENGSASSALAELVADSVQGRYAA
ncbi:MAG: hypothetical protein ACREUK_13295 [Burkholderiales bacterium]